MAKCDVCGSETSRVKSPTYAPDEMQRVVANGFVPDDATLNRWQAEQNLSRDALVSNWIRRVDRAPTEWLLCPNCAARAAQYRRSGVAQKRLPRWLPWLIGAAALVAIVLIVNALIPKAQARSLGGFDLDRAAMTALAFSPDGSLLAAGDAEQHMTNAISSIIAIGALVQIATPDGGSGRGLILALAILALALTAVNMLGGFAVTQRMLAMFRK